MDRTIKEQSTRRHFLSSQAMGLGSIALASMLYEEKLQATPRKPDTQPASFDLAARQPHHAPRARSVISLWMQGGPSHIDLFDPKPELNKLDGQKFPGKVK